jgi:Condensation domain/TubC N-terminal docking domain
MSTAIDLMLSLQERGVKIWIEGEQLRCRSPKGIMLPEELEELRALRLEIIELLQGTQSIAAIPLESRIGSAPIALTAMQRMPYYCAEKPHPRTMPFGLRIFGALDIEVLQRSLDSLVRRHESLRTRILMTGDPPSQQIDVARDYYLDVVAMTGASRSVAEQLVQPRIQEFVDQTIDPSIGPLFDARVFKVADDEHILVISIDHVISDAMSNQILVEELWALYNQAVTGQPVALPPLSLQFADYALWLEKIHPFWQELHGPYWKKRFAAAPRIRWPIERDTAEKRGMDYAVLKVPIDERLTAALADFACRERTPLPLVILAVYLVVVSRWCNQTDLTVVLVDSGRHYAGLVRMIGLLATHLHLRVEFKKNQTYRGLLHLVKQEFYSASCHRDFDWMPSLIPELKADLFFNWNWSSSIDTDPGVCSNASDQPHEKISIEFLPVEISVASAVAFDPAMLPITLELGCVHMDGELTAHLVYRADLFAAQTIERIARDLRTSFECMLTSPGAVYQGAS